MAKEQKKGFGKIALDPLINMSLVFPDILREFNPSLKGFSVGTGKETTSKASFNQAVAGAKSE